MDADFSQCLDFYCQEDRYSFRHFDNRSLKKRFANIIKFYVITLCVRKVITFCVENFITYILRRNKTYLRKGIEI